MFGFYRLASFSRLIHLLACNKNFRNETNTVPTKDLIEMNLENQKVKKILEDLLVTEKRAVGEKRADRIVGRKCHCEKNEGSQGREN